MQYENTWEIIYDKQTEILKKNISSANIFMYDAARQLVDYREHLESNDIGLDIICYATILEAHKRGQKAFDCGFDSNANPFYSLEKVLDIILENFIDSIPDKYERFAYLESIKESAENLEI